jgi:hypothetical protein
VAAFAGLFMELRWEHREAIGETWHAWIPLVFCGAATLLGLLGVALWHGWGRALLLGCFAVACAIGVLGSFFHGGKHPIQRVERVVSAWTLKPGDDGGTKVGEGPPVLAPGAFVGLGLIGLIAGWRPKRIGGS